jgi:hypothetical protein
MVVQSSGANGAVTIVSATPGGSPAAVGDVLVANVIFHTIATGTAAVTVASNSTALSADTNTNVLAAFTGTTVTIPKARGGKRH